MKFATLALIGAVSATEETELVGKMWRWKHIPKIMEQEMRVKDAFEDVEDDLEDAFEKIGESLDGKFEKYIPELEAWGQSKVVLAKKAHDKKMMESDMGQEFLRSLEQVGEDATTVHWASGFDQDGYKEWIKNEDLAMMFEDVYAVKEAFKKLVESKMAMVTESSEVKSSRTSTSRKSSTCSTKTWVSRTT